VTVIIEGIYAKVRWLAPTNNFSAITGYRVLVKNSLAIYIDQTTDCNEHNSASITETWCYIPMVNLLETPYLLVQGNAIQARVIAANDRGESLVSDPNVVAPLVQVVPHKMSSV